MGEGEYKQAMIPSDLGLANKKKKKAMIPLQGMAEHRFTSVYIYQCLFIGEIIFSP